MIISRTVREVRPVITVATVRTVRTLPDDPKQVIKLGRTAALKLTHFIGKEQMSVILSAMRGEEGAWFAIKMIEMAELVENMAGTYDQHDKGNEAIVYLHYFTANTDAYITEKDKGSEDDEVKGVQHQAFGLSYIWELEMGYISLPELFRARAELDLHFTPTTVGKIREKYKLA